MKYILSIKAIGKFPEVTLDETNYKEIKKAWEILYNGFAMEEKYELLISNYLEFEIEILKQATQSMIRQPDPDNYDVFSQVIISLQRRLLNFLTAARLYVDQLHRHICVTMCENKNAKDLIDNLFSREYDSEFYYRFMEALRNYVQHRGIAIHTVQFKCNADDTGEIRLLNYTMDITSLKDLLQEDNEFKKAVLEESPEKIDLKKAARVYIEGISRIHKDARKLIEQSLVAARSKVENAIKSYSNVFSKKIIGLHALCKDGNKLVESIPLTLKWDDVRIKLSKRNLELVDLKNRFVSS